MLRKCLAPSIRLELLGTARVSALVLRETLVVVDGIDSQGDQLAGGHPGIEEQPDDGGIASALECVPLAGAENRLNTLPGAHD